jgi:hypothetical protein
VVDLELYSGDIEVWLACLSIEWWPVFLGLDDAPHRRHSRFELVGECITQLKLS